MEIKIRKELRGEFDTIEINKGMAIEELVLKYAGELPYTVVAAKKDNDLVDLTETIDNPCIIEFLDIRTQAANLIYQYSLSLIYLKAVKDILGDVNVDIQNSLSKGLYTTIACDTVLTDKQVADVENRMRDIVEADLPFVKEEVSVSEAERRFIELDQPEKLALLHKKADKVRFYSLEGYSNFFYGLMVPSTGYIKYFELKKYRRGVIVRFPHPTMPDVIPEYKEEVKLYDAFGEATVRGRIMGVSFVSDLNRKVENGEYKELIQLSEALHEKKIAEIADMITRRKKRIVLIAGPSSSGKTTFARRLCIQLKVNGLNPLYLGTDDYFVERTNTPLDEYGEHDYENLGAVDIELFNSNMNDLLAGREVDLPEFDFMEGKKTFGKRITKIKQTQPIVIEGIHALNGDLTPYIDDGEKFRIYISPFTQLNIDRHNRIPTTDARMLRRLVRDYQYRGHSAQSTISSWPKVRAGEDKNIFPYNDQADVLFNSVHIYELAVLKKYAEPLLKDIKEDEPEYSEAVRMLKFLRFFRTIEDDSIIVNNSIIREFIGGSIFVD